MKDQELMKSIDAMIDDLFTEETIEKSEDTPIESKEDDVEDTANEGDVEKSMIKDIKPQKETADEGEKPPKGQDDDKRGAGRPKEISDVPKVDTDGKRAKDYDKDITDKKSEKDGKNPEQSQVVPAKELVKKSEFSEEEYAEYQELKKAKAESEVKETLRKAKEEQTDLIKSAVNEATETFRKENDELKKSLEEQTTLIKSIANKPQKSKAVTSVQAIEKSFGSEGEPKEESLNKAELLDIAEELIKAKKLTVEQVIELENTGYIFDETARGVLEREVKRRR